MCFLNQFSEKFLRFQRTFFKKFFGGVWGKTPKPFYTKKIGDSKRAVLLRTVFGVHYLPTEKKQKPQIDFLRFLCYNGNINDKLEFVFSRYHNIFEEQIIV